MPTTDSKPLQNAIRRTLAHRAGDAPDANTVAEATFNTWQLMAARLTPVIGAHGVDVIFSRSLHLTSNAFPWLAISGDKGDSAALQACLKACLASRETDTAAEASNAFLVTVVELLSALIGESLTERLLGPAWVPQVKPSEQESTS